MIIRPDQIHASPSPAGRGAHFQIHPAPINNRFLKSHASSSNSPPFFFLSKHCSPLGDLINVYYNLWNLISLRTNVSWKESVIKTESRSKTKRNSLFRKKNPQTTNNQSESITFQKRRGIKIHIQIIYWTNTCSGVTPHFQDMHPIILKLHAGFFLLRVIPSDLHLYQLFGVKVLKQAIICYNTWSRTEQDREVPFFPEKVALIQDTYSLLKRNVTSSIQRNDLVQFKLWSLWVHYTLMIPGCCSFHGTAASQVTLPRLGSSTQEPSRTFSFQMNFTTT